MDSIGGARRVRKHRRFYAPLLVALGAPLVRMMNTGVRVLPRKMWESRERALYASLYGAEVETDERGWLLLPHLAGTTLAAVLEKQALGYAVHDEAIMWAVRALADLHAREITHGDAMAENVMVDRGAGVARWFDFETMHDARRSLEWRRADDVRALLATCVLRTTRGRMAEVVDMILDTYGDPEITHLVADAFASPFRRALAFHLGQAPLSARRFQEVGWLLRRRVAGR